MIFVSYLDDGWICFYVYNTYDWNIYYIYDSLQLIFSYSYELKDNKIAMSKYLLLKDEVIHTLSNTYV